MRIDPAALETRGLKNYYDQAALDDQFGEDAEEQMLDATDGLGAGFTDDTGRHLRRGADGETHEMTPGDARRIIDRNATDLGELGPGESPEQFEERT